MYMRINDGVFSFARIELLHHLNCRGFLMVFIIVLFLFIYCF